MSKQEKIEGFDPNGPGLIDGGLFGLPFDVEDAEIVILPVPWDVTVSFGDGTRNGPEAILWASKQVDLYYSGVKDAWKMGIALREVPMEWKDLNKHYRKKAQVIIEKLEKGADESDPEIQELLTEVNEQCAELVEYVSNRSIRYLDKGKIVAVLGGDHSTPLGLINALAERNESFGILQIDAHADLRNAYEGFTYSHASIMRNALENEQISKMVSVGVRDICDEEMDFIFGSNERVVGFFDEHIKRKLFAGKSWDSVCDEIISELPQKVYISFDIDGLEPSLCPNTGTPVPGGLSFEQAVYLVKKVVESGKTIIGFDLCEVSDSENGWDANVGARLLYHLCNQTGLSNGKMPS
jgi:agmatinase